MLTTKRILFPFVKSCAFLKVGADLGYAFEYSTLVMKIACGSAHKKKYGGQDVQILP